MVFEGALLRAVGAPPRTAQVPIGESRRDRRIAVVVPRLPYPARRDGMAVRYFPLIDHLAERYPVDVVVLGAYEADPPEEAPAWTRSAIYLEWPPASEQPLTAKLATLGRVLAPGGHPVIQSVHGAPRLAEDLATLLLALAAEAVLWVGPGGVDLADRTRRRTPGMRWTMDFIDSPARLMRGVRRGTGVKGWLQRVEIAHARSWESKVRRSFDAAVYVSRPDAEFAGSVSPGVHVLPNGVLPPEAPVVRPEAAPVIGFLGNLNYPPNAAAVRRLRDRIFPVLRERAPEVTLLVIGRGPPADVRECAGHDIEVTGEVESIWEPMARVAVFVFPIDTGAGMQNKLLEAMTLGAAVVTTPGCAGAIGASPGVHCLVATTDEEFVDAAIRLLGDASLRSALGSRAEKLVQQHFNWRELLPAMERLVIGPEA